MSDSNLELAEDYLPIRGGALTDELGYTGLKQYGGYIYEEFLPALSGTQGQKVYIEMRNNDPVIGAMLRAIEMLIRQAPWDVQAAGTSPRELEDAEFLKQVRDDMDGPFKELISEALSMLWLGYSVHEICYKLRKGPNAEIPSDYSDGKVGWRRMPIRGQETIAQWDFDDHGDVLAVFQFGPPDYREVKIPYEKVLHFRTEPNKGNPEGRSVLRNAYRPWFIKKRIEETEAIGADRDLAGIPVAYVPARLLSPNANAEDKSTLADIKRVLRNIRCDQQSSVVFPLVFDDKGNQLYKLELLGHGGTKLFDTDIIVKRHDSRIAMVVLADFIVVGHEAVGSYALNSSKTKLFSMAIGAWLDSICETINRSAVRRLFRINGREAPYPRFTHGDIEAPDLKELGEFVGKMAGVGALTLPAEEIEAWVRRLAGAPQKTDESPET